MSKQSSTNETQQDKNNQPKLQPPALTPDLTGEIAGLLSLPGSYLVTHYQDRQRGLVIRSIYYEDGRVESYNGQEQRLVCHFSKDQVEQAKAAIRTSGLLTAPEITAEGFFDTASNTYAWSLDGHRGQVTNWAYPARSHPAFEALERRLNELEDESSDAS